MRKFIFTILHIGLTPQLSFSQIRNLRIVNGISVLIILMSIPYAIPAFLATSWVEIKKVILINIVSTLPAFIVIYFNYRKKYFLAIFFLIIFFTFFLSLLPFITGRYGGSHLALTSVLVGTVLLLENRWLSIFLFILTYFAFAGANIAQSPDNYFQVEVDYLTFTIGVFVNGFLLYYAIYAFKTESQQYQSQLENQKEEIQTINDELSQTNQLISDSILYAERIQQAILPENSQIGHFLESFFIFFKPKDIVSGDFYSFYPLTEKQVIVIVGDCTGHGVPGAMMSMLATNLLDQIILEKEIYEPSLILEELHKAVRKALRQNTNQNQDGLDIGICQIDLQNQSLIFAGATQNLIYIQNQQIAELKGNRRNIGGGSVYASETPFLSQKLTWTAQNPIAFYLSSDGYKDQFGGKQKKKITTEGFKKLLYQIHTLSPEAQKQAMEQYITHWKNESQEEQTDDLTVWGIVLA
ncbi:MAG: hypothetical protein EAZ55_00855 [Cytophagales bacterium]|nr:MAG: hypothetical protein EAZ55_00855 [Cytophagales bacterium]